MECKCNVEPRVRRGGAIQEGGKTYWQQIFYCDNPNCDMYQKDIGVRKINVLDETDIVEEKSL
jgi:hypothetical protein